MEIDPKLIEFKSKISPALDGISNAASDLASKISSFQTLTNNASSSLSSCYKSDGTVDVKTQISYLNSVSSLLSDSLTTELNAVISKCKAVDAGIVTLEAILTKYNAALSKYNSDKADPDKTADYSPVSILETQFKNKQTEVLNLYNLVMASDASCTKLNAFTSSGSVGTDDSGLLGYSGTMISYMWEENGVIYQKFMPVCKGKVIQMEENFVIVYNVNNMLSADNEKGTEAVNYLRSVMKSGEFGYLGTRLWDYNSKKYSNSESEKIAKVMNQVLEDTYKANNCSSISDYAAVAGMVLSSSLVNLRYTANNVGNTVGFDSICKAGGFVCNHFVAWCFTQGLYKTGNDTKITDFTPLNIYSHYSKSVSTMSSEEIQNWPIGSVVTKKYPGNLHIGIVVGHTTIDGEPAVVVAQSGGLSGSFCMAYKISQCFGDSTTQWQRYATPSMMETRVKAGNNKNDWIA